MKVVVTGSSGKLGRVLMQVLRAHRYEAVGVDRLPSPDGAAEGHVQADLRDIEAYRSALRGANAVVHAAALPRVGEPGELVRDNLEATVSLARSTLAEGVAKFIYVSSIQVIASERDTRDDPKVAYLPLDGDSPPQPTNAYAWSKFASEVVVRELLGGAGVQCVNLRLPWLTGTAPGAPRGLSLKHLSSQETCNVVEQGFSYLSVLDAAEIVTACIRTDLPGVRIYLPAVSAVAPELVPTYLSRYYAGVPLRVPLAKMTDLVDVGRITRETGWRPLHVEKSRPPASGWIGRRLASRLGLPRAE